MNQANKTLDLSNCNVDIRVYPEPEISKVLSLEVEVKKLINEISKLEKCNNVVLIASQDSFIVAFSSLKAAIEDKEKTKALRETSVEVAGVPLKR